MDYKISTNMQHWMSARISMAAATPAAARMQLAALQVLLLAAALRFAAFQQL
jgi:glycogen debranching enzyme